MALIEPEFGRVLYPEVKWKLNRTWHLRSTSSARAAAERVVSNCPEVMVKITGFSKGSDRVKAHLDYISRNGKVTLENDRGEVLSGKDQVKGICKDWQEDLGDKKRHKNQRDTMHLVLSMPAKTDPEFVRSAARAFAKATFGKNHEYVFALHTDEPHPHCHVTVKCLGFDGTRLNPRKADLQLWREGFAAKLRDQGVDAEATPRRARGTIRKPERSVIRHIERGDKSHKPRVSKVRALKIKAAAAELTAEANGLLMPEKPWENALKVRQNDVRQKWLTAADQLERMVDSGSGSKTLVKENKSLAGRIRAFVSAMPSVETEFHQIKRDLVQRFSQQTEQEHSEAEQGRANLRRSDIER